MKKISKINENIIPVKVGVIGIGNMGWHHARVLSLLKDAELIGVADLDEERGKLAMEQFNCNWYGNYKDLLHQVEAVCIAVPTLFHHEVGLECLKSGKHVLIEKPIAANKEEASSLINASNNAKKLLQVGHIERFNPAFRELTKVVANEEVVVLEARRHSPHPERANDVSVVLELMIHDIDIILSIVRSGVKKVSASGVSVISETHDIANARIEFDNGCVANLTSSRISLKNMRKTRFFQKDAYISVDFLDKKLEVFQMEELQGEADPFDIVLDLGTDKPKKKILIDKPDIAESNAIKEELIAFYNSIVNDSETPVTIEDGLNAMLVAHQVLDEMSKIYLQ